MLGDGVLTHSVSIAYRRLAASVVISALTSLATKDTASEVHAKVIALHGEGNNSSQIARRLNMATSSVASVLGKVGPDARQFLLSDNPFVENCGIGEGCIRQIVEKIEGDPDEARKVLVEIKREAVLLT
jgi:hypothetical protein